MSPAVFIVPYLIKYQGYKGPILGKLDLTVCREMRTLKKHLIKCKAHGF
jgi:hypothetical protein